MKKIFQAFRNLKVKLFVSFLLVLMIPGIFIGYLSYSTAKESVVNEILDGIEENLNLLNISINNMIQSKLHDVDTFSQKVSSTQYNFDSNPELSTQFGQYMQLHPEVELIYLGTETGLFIQEPNTKMSSDYDPKNRDWYKNAMTQEGKVVISDPYISATTNNMVVTVSKTTQDGSGVVAIDIKLTYIQELTNQVQIGDKGYALLLDAKKKFISHPTAEIGSEAGSFYNNMYKHEKGNFEYVLNDDNKVMSYVTNEMTGWKIGGNVIYSEINEATAPILHKTGLVILLSIIIGIIAVYFIIKSVIKPIVKLREKALTISQGDLTENIIVNSKDEIGHLGDAFNTMLESLRSLIDKVEQTAEIVASSSEELSANAQQTSDTTEMVSTSIQEVSQNAEKQTNSVDSNAQSLAEITIGIDRIANHASKVSELSYEAITQAEMGGQAITNTVNQMSSIHTSVIESNTKINSLSVRSQEVRSILNVITEIADQTNLLALNAAIEAARAGEYGKGFAVVADEVRKLAEQSQQSAKDIHEIILGIQEDTESSVQIMARVTEDVQAGVEVSNDAIKKFTLIMQSMKEITPQMEDVSATAQQVSASVQETSHIANDIAILAQGNAATSEEVAASAEEQLASMEEISASAQSLSSMAQELKDVISQFKY
ncbi:methyl-accepting chemotaxis protein [Psychrobacillus sp. FSL K6-2365]|uniref:methyl-accepting chemotaxis protein n=1 Tax=Psychrobacillus sp. FSL K6-2365 TaxID=2921546 RepID=UPI0030F58EF8